MERVWQFFNGSEFRDCREEINRQNRQAIHVLVLAGLPLSILNLLVQAFIIDRDASPLRLCWMVIFFAAAMFVDRKLIPADYPHSTLMLYLFEAPVMLISILLGTVLDANHQATTFLLFMVALPVFVLDRPDRSVAFLSCWMVLFLIMEACFKTDELRLIDSLHALEFFFASLTVTFVVLRVRLESLRHLIQARYHLNHDAHTGCLSRYALDDRASRYIDRPLLILLADMDQFKLYSDFYGHDAADAMTRYFSRAVMERFGEENTYRYSADEILCVLPGATVGETLTRVEACREQLRAFEHEGKAIALSCAVGYVTGTPEDVHRFHDMIHLADIYAHRAKQRGQDQNLGSAFDRQRLREGIVESNVAAQAHAYETNQLTGLPGMSYFVMRGDELLSTVADMGRHPVVGHFKLMRLRDFNNEFGYAQGDALIAFTAKQLKLQLSARHICYITAGQFGILCYRDEAEAAIGRVNEALRGFRPDFPMYGLAGFAEYTGGDKTISLMDQAKIAQHSLRKSGGGPVRFYDAQLDEETRFTQYILGHIDEAVEKNWLKVYYQPIVRSVSGEVCSDEALSRWDDPRYGFLMPGRFIPPLEEAGLMYKVNLHAVKQVLEDFKFKRDKGMPLVPVSVNLSRKDFERCDMVGEITAMIDASGFSRDLIKIEITESAFISNQELLTREVRRFRNSGLEVWLDDFGSEYSTLNLLQELDFDLIKIDMKFMKNFSREGKNFIIVSNIIDMAKRLGVTTLIEGVETPEQFRAMRQLGCERIQGFLFNRPNTMEYIAQRAQNGTGLTFERPELTAYYDAVGRVDLREPMRGGSLSMEQTPAGVIELRDGRFDVLTGNDGFEARLRLWGVLAEDGDARHPRLIDPAPEPLTRAAEACRASEDWTSFSATAGDESALSVYARRVASSSDASRLALLIVILQR